ESLALFGARGLNLVYRLGVPVAEHTQVAEHFVLRPISEALTKSHAFYILGVSKNKVRLLDATKDSVVQLDLQDIVPASFEDVFDTDDRQAQLQNRSVGTTERYSTAMAVLPMPKQPKPNNTYTKLGHPWVTYSVGPGLNLWCLLPFPEPVPRWKPPPLSRFTLEALLP